MQGARRGGARGRRGPAVALHRGRGGQREGAARHVGVGRAAMAAHGVSHPPAAGWDQQRDEMRLIDGEARRGKERRKNAGAMYGGPRCFGRASLSLTRVRPSLGSLPDLAPRGKHQFGCTRPSHAVRDLRGAGSGTRAGWRRGRAAPAVHVCPCSRHTRPHQPEECPGCVCVGYVVLVSLCALWVSRSLLPFRFRGAAATHAEVPSPGSVHIRFSPHPVLAFEAPSGARGSENECREAGGLLQTS